MGTGAFNNLLMSVQGLIGILNNTSGVLMETVVNLKTRSHGEGPKAEEAARHLEEIQGDLDKMRTKIDALKEFFVQVKSKWSQPKDRVIGYAVWAPAISIATPPYSYTKDVCVVKLDEEKFTNFKGNVLDLGACRPICL